MSARWSAGLVGCALVLGMLLIPAPASPADPASSVAESRSAATPVDTQTVYVVIGVAHTDIVIPRAAFAAAPSRVKAAVDQLDGGPWIILGWGPYWFGRDEPGDTYNPAGVRTANLVFTLLAPQRASRLRVGALATPGAAPAERYVSMIPVRLSSAGLGRAVARIDRSFKADEEGRPIITYRPPSEPNVVIYLSGEHYSLAHECDHWIAEVLRAGGVSIEPGLDFTPALLALRLRTAAAPASPSQDASAVRPPP